MHILLTGAAGFTGLHFQRHAQAAGHTVLPLRANLTDKAAVAAEVACLQPDAVVHLAAISFVGHADDTAFYAVNVIGTMNLLAALAAQPTRPSSVLLASSANIYGNCDTSPIAETQAPAPVNHYAMSKLAMEYMARTWADRLPILFARPFNYTGPGQAPQFVIPKLVDHCVRKAGHVELGNLHVQREFNDVCLVCEAYLALLHSGQPGEAYNICTGRPYTLQQVLDTLRTLTGHALQVRVNPQFVRANEVHCLYGDPSKLQATTGIDTGRHDLADTLRAMLAQASAPLPAQPSQ